ETPVFEVCATELCPVSARAARIRTENRITARSECGQRVDTPSTDKCLLKYTRWSTVNIQYQWYTVTSLITNRVRKQAFNLFSVFRFPADHFRPTDSRQLQIPVHAAYLHRSKG